MFGLDQESIERIEGLTNTKNLETFKHSLHVLTNEMLDEGWEKEDVIKYIKTLI